MCKWRGQRIMAQERIKHLRRCLDNSVVPREIYEKVKKVRAKFAASIGRAFIKNEIVLEEEKLDRLLHKLDSSARTVKFFLSFFDWIRFNKMLGETGGRLRGKLRASNMKSLQWLKIKRFGTSQLITESVFILSSVTLTPAQLEVLSRGPRFGIPREVLYVRKKF